jgi:hypothetical protein
MARRKPLRANPKSEPDLVPALTAAISEADEALRLLSTEARTKRGATKKQRRRKMAG